MCARACVCVCVRVRVCVCVCARVCVCVHKPASLLAHPSGRATVVFERSAEPALLPGSSEGVRQRRGRWERCAGVGVEGERVRGGAGRGRSSDHDRCSVLVVSQQPACAG